jgi:hypothetical protein
MGKSDDYRRFAKECLELAKIAENETSRAVFLQMAQVWFRLAEERPPSKDGEGGDTGNGA